MPKTRAHSAATVAVRVAAALLRSHGVLALLVAADALTKQVAFHLLPAGRPVDVGYGVVFFLALNEWGVMGGVEGIGSVTANPVYTLLLALGLLGVAYGVRRLAVLELRFPLRLLGGLGIFFVAAGVARVAARPFADVDLPAGLVVGTIRAAAMVLSLTLYSVARAPMARTAFTLLLAGSLANGLSYLLPPFDVVDFVRIPLPGRSDAFGVINVADVYIASSVLALAVWPMVAVRGWRRESRRLRQQRSRAGRIRSGAAAAGTGD